LIDKEIVCSSCAIRRAGDIGGGFAVGDIVYCDDLRSLGKVLRDASSGASSYNGYRLKRPIIVSFANGNGSRDEQAYSENGVNDDYMFGSSIVFAGRDGIDLL
jgi:hypothetical protein